MRGSLSSNPHYYHYLQDCHLTWVIITCLCGDVYTLLYAYNCDACTIGIVNSGVYSHFLLTDTMHNIFLLLFKMAAMSGIDLYGRTYHKELL